jgi:hypothetical protein
VSEPLGLTLATFLTQGKGYASVKKALWAQVGQYGTQKFEVRVILFDGESTIGPMAGDLGRELSISVEQVAPGSHVGKVERKIRVIKERMRCVLCTLTFTLPFPLLKWLVYYCVSRINMLPSRLRDNLVSPREAFLGRKTDFNRDLRIAFGDYVQVYKEHTFKNAVDIPRTEGAIALLPTGSREGSVQFLLLNSGAIVTRSRWKEGSFIPDEVISLLNARAQNQKHQLSKEPIFRYGTATGEDNVGPVEDEDLPPELPAPPPAHIVPAPAGDDDMPELEAEPDEPAAGAGPAGVHVDDPPPQTVEPAAAAGVHEAPPAGVHEAPTAGVPEVTPANEMQPLGGAVSTPAPEPEPPPSQSQRYFLRPSRSSWKYAERVHNVTVREAIRKFENHALRSIYEEMLQMPQKNVFHPVDPSTLTQEQWKKVIPSKMFLKEKFLPTGEFDKLKARLVAGGHRQDKSTYDDVSSPTVAITSAFMVAAIAAMEGRCVATVDITGAYLNATMSGQTVLMRLDQTMAAVLVQIRPDYRPFLTKNGGMVVQLDKALYGCIESAKLWYQDLRRTLEDMGFKANANDACVFNKTIDGKQCTVCVYVDDLFITCKNLTSIEWVIARLRKAYKTLTEQVGGTVHNYLGMTFDFSKIGEVSVDMQHYIKECMETYEVQGKNESPASEHLFTVRADAALLTAELSEKFHSRVAKLLYLAKRVRPEILTAISFLTTRVQKPDEDDWRKLQRVLRYLNGSRSLGVTLAADPADFRVHVHIDASYGVHADMKSHTGMTVSLGRGPVFVRSSKQRIVTKSSTEAELVGCSDSVSQAIWTRDFLIEQGHAMGPVTVHQDNMSAMQLAKNGRSSSDRTRHIAIRYFWIKDRVESGEVEIVHQRTAEMVADLLTKPILGERFLKLRAILLGRMMV